MAVKYANQVAEEITNRNISYKETVNGEAFEEWLHEKNNSRLFGLKRPEDVFPKNIYQKMKCREKAFVLFTQNMQVYDRKSYDEWIAKHGLLNETPRITYMYVDGNRGKGYVVNYNRAMKSILIPDDVLSLPYDKFMQEILYGIS